MGYPLNLTANYSKLSLRVAFLACTVASGAIWITQGTLIGAIFAGIFAGLICSMPIGFGISKNYYNSGGESITTTLAIFLMIGLYLYKSEVVMPVSWLPPKYFDVVGMVSWMATITTVFFTLTPKESCSPEYPQASVKSPSTEAPANPVSLTNKIYATLGFLLVVVSIVIQIFLAFPEKVGPSEIALNRHLYKTTHPAFLSNNPSTLDYYLSSGSSGEYTSIKQEDNKVYATLIVDVPVLAGLSQEIVDNPIEYKKYNKTNTYPDRVTTVTQDVVFEKSGLGWKVTKATAIPSALELSKQYDNARNDSITIKLLSNAFGFYEMLTKPFNILWLAWLMISVSLIIVRPSVLCVIFGAITLVSGISPLMLTMFG